MAPKTPEVIVENRVTVRPGLESVPNFVKKLDAEKSTSAEYLTGMINNLSNEIESKEQMKSDLIQNHVSNERIENLRKSNEKLMEELIDQKDAVFRDVPNFSPFFWPWAFRAYFKP